MCLLFTAYSLFVKTLFFLKTKIKKMGITDKFFIFVLLSEIKILSIFDAWKIKQVFGTIHYSDLL